MKRYEVIVSLVCTEIDEEGVRTELVNVPYKYGSLPYYGMFAVQQVMSGVIATFASWGWSRLSEDETKTVKEMLK